MSLVYRSYDEIQTQEMAWKEAVRVTLEKKKEIEEFFDSARPSEVIFVGCTSPYYAGYLAASYWRTETGLQARAIPSSDLVLFPEHYYPKAGGNPVLIALSRSGKTTETNWAVEEFERRYHGRTVLIGCNPHGVLADFARLKILLPESAEETIPQSRSLGSFYIAALMMAAFRSGNTKAIETLTSAPGKANAILRRSEATIEALFEKKQYSNIFILGQGPLFGVAQEASVKFMEMANQDAFSFPFLETRHGPRSLIDENSLVIGLYSQAGCQYEAQLMEELTLINQATTLAVTPREGWQTGKVTASISVDCDWPDSFTGLAYLPVTQLAAYYCAVPKGLNPDEARFHTLFVEIKRF